jgi:hypothetical protein
VAAVVFLSVLVIGGFFLFRQMTAPVPLPPAARLADAGTLGLALVRLEPEDPWIKGTLAELSKYSTEERKPADLFPIELIWAARRGSPEPEGHILSMTLSRNGRLVGMFGDVALWRAGRSVGGKVSRVEHHGEGITSFPGTSINGHVFIRDGTVVWSSDLDTAKAAVDLTLAAEGAAPPAEAGTSQVPIAALLPQESPHAIAGAILNENGSLSRILGVLPGDALDIPADRLAAVSLLTFTFDATSATEGGGEVVLQLAEGASSEEARRIADDLAGRLLLVKLAQVVFQATPRLESNRAFIAVKATGLDSLGAPLIQEMVRSFKKFESLKKGEAPPVDPNQSSSTFQ